MSITFKTRIPPFPAERLEAISKVLADIESQGIKVQGVGRQAYRS